MNIITDLSSYKQNNSVYNAILMIIDCYIKMTKYISISKTLIVIELADIFFKEIVCWYDISKKIVSDRDSIFISSYWLQICYQTRIKCRLNIIFYFQIDEQTECQNQILKHYLHYYCNDKQNN